MKKKDSPQLDLFNKKPATISGADLKAVIEVWCDVFKRRTNLPFFPEGKDIGLIRAVIKNHGVETTKELILYCEKKDYFWKSSPCVTKFYYNVATFKSELDSTKNISNAAWRKEL